MITVATDLEMKLLGQKLGERFRGGEVIELIGDVGAGKTTLAKGIGFGLNVDEDIQSPSFTISRSYEAHDGLSFQHYDFYRLQEPGVMSYELSESVADSSAIVLVEWAETVSDVLPDERIVVRINYHADDGGRDVELVIPAKYSYLEVD